MYEIFGLLGFFGPILLIVLLFVSIGHGRRLSQIESRLADLMRRLSQLESVQRAPGREDAPSVPAEAPPVVSKTPVRAEPSPAEPVSVEPAPEPGTVPPIDVAPPPPAAPPTVQPRFDWERFVGLRLPVWLGAIALSVAGFFFVSYAIESGFFTPEMRVLSAAAASLVFLAGAEFVRRRVTTGNPAAIAAALAAASIATAYATAYLATLTYGLIPSGAGFIVTALVSVLAIAVALAFGEVVALVGIVGGYVAPLVYGSGDANAPFLVIYLLALTAVTFGVIRHKNWWRLSALGLIAPTLWGVVWAATPVLRDDAIWGSIYLIGYSAIVTVATWSGWRESDPRFSPRDLRPLLTPARTALLAAVTLSALGFLVFIFDTPLRTTVVEGSIVAITGRNFGHWQGFIVFVALLVALGFASLQHRFLQLPALAAYALGIAMWSMPDRTAATIVCAAGAIIFGFGALDQFRRLREPGLWAATLAFVAVVFLVLALFKTVGWQGALDNRHLWALGAIAVAAGFVVLMRLFGPQLRSERQRSQVYAAWGGAVTTLISLAVTLELDPLYFPSAAALAILGLAAVHVRAPVRGLRVVAVVYLIVYALLLLGALSYGGGPVPPHFSYVFARDFSSNALALMVIPGIALLASATLFQISRPVETRALVTILDIAAIIVVVIGLFYLLAWPYAFARWSDTLVLASRIIGPELGVAAVAVYVGRRFDRAAAYTGGIILTGIIALVILAGLLVPLLAFWPPFAVPGTLLINITLVTYGVPALLLYFIGWYLRHDSRNGIRIYGIGVSVFAVIVTYAMLMIDIRHAYHLGSPTLQGDMSQSEFYAYSIGTLAFGLALLIGGVAFRHRGARAVSFFFVLAATIKVFLFDASELTGLWRVLSFLLMGLAFLGISWAYARFVFGIGLNRPKPPETPQLPVESPAPQA
jgi:uncharacterized membrane protein